jgi:hypothetical protein
VSPIRPWAPRHPTARGALIEAIAVVIAVGMVLWDRIDEFLEHRIEQLGRHHDLVVHFDGGYWHEGPTGDNRPSTEDLLGIAPDWLGGQSVDEYIDDIRGDE